MTYKEYFSTFTDSALADFALRIQDSIDNGSFGTSDLLFLEKAHQELTDRGYSTIWEAHTANK